MKQKAPKKNNDNARERLLDEAERLIGQKGPDAVTVREITSAAGANVAAVTYYFGGKKNLYLTVVRERWVPRARRIIKPLDDLVDSGEATIEQAVEGTARAFLMGFANDQERELHLQIIQRELAQPSEALGIILQEAIVPTFQRLTAMINRSLPQLSSEKAFLCVYSIFAQVVHFCFGRAMVSGLMNRPFDEKVRETVVEHITRFSLEGLRGVSD
ncbi:MAG: CerR family C-terminal domain-containing protein [Desulfarculaceae bacterium]